MQGFRHAHSHRPLESCHPTRATPRVAALDDSTERIVGYLNAREIPSNVLCFQVFTYSTEQLLARTWLLDPVRTQASAAATPDSSNEPWNGEFYCNFNDGEHRSWADAV